MAYADAQERLAGLQGTSCGAMEISYLPSGFESSGRSGAQLVRLELSGIEPACAGRRLVVQAQSATETLGSGEIVAEAGRTNYRVRMNKPVDVAKLTSFTVLSPAA